MTIAEAVTIPMFDYREQFAEIRGEILDAIESVLASGSLILGERVREFEENFCQYLGGGGDAVGVGNGTDALAIALRALEIGAGDEVITVANTAIPTVSAIRMAGARPVFCEIDADTLLMDLDHAESRITSRTRAIVPVHLFGNAVDMTRLMKLAAQHGLGVVEDCAVVRHDLARTNDRHVRRRWLFFVLPDQEPGGLWRRRAVHLAKPWFGRSDAEDSRLWLRAGEFGTGVRGRARRGEQPPG